MEDSHKENHSNASVYWIWNNKYFNFYYSVLWSSQNLEGLRYTQKEDFGSPTHAKGIGRKDRPKYE